VNSTEPGSGRTIAFVMAIIAAAFVVRLIVVLSMNEDVPWFDAREYHRLATGLCENWSYDAADGSPTAYWPPGYPFFLALVYLLFGPSLAALRVVQACVGALTCAVVYLIAKRLLDRRTALLAAAILAIYPLAVYTAGTPYPAALQTFLVACVVYLCLTAKAASSATCAVGSGAIAGCSALVAPSALPAFLLAALWLAWPMQGRQDSPLAGGQEDSAGQARRPRGRLLAVLFLIPLVLIIGAWSARNYRALGKPVAISTNGGFNFWLGNHPGVTATTGNRMTASMRRELGAVYGRHKNEADRDSVLYAKAREYIGADPGRFVRLSFEKALNLWRLYPSPATEVRPAGGMERLLSLLSYGLLLPFGVFWLLRRLKDSDGARLVLLLFIGFTVVHALFISKVRFRIPIDPYLIVYASAALLAVADLVRGMTGRASL
jgi:hypothetical protein